MAVTESTVGIGMAIATTLAREAANVIVTGRGEKRAKEAAEHPRAGGARGEARGLTGKLETAEGGTFNVFGSPAPAQVTLTPIETANRPRVAYNCGRQTKNNDINAI
ncbi:MAG TPA: hypothetical protein VG326_20040 [Tepidisphaeraceae bacterium]|jgi:NAD(P)-dependent dehydrogenase (short-subunit alcohol dehydrogenase family)|nr:hypothetical protein [Tepidisphaeraceae bacterium]